jgi:translocator protein
MSSPKTDGATKGTPTNTMNPVIQFPSPSATRVPATAVWLTLSAVALGSGLFISPDGWYEGLAKPDWTPRGSYFVPAALLFYALMAASAWLVWREGGWRQQSWPLRLFLAQFLLSTMWAPLFFGQHWTGWATADLLVLWLALAAGIAAVAQAHQVAAILLAPCLCAATFGVMVNFAIWQLNS